MNRQLNAGIKLGLASLLAASIGAAIAQAPAPQPGMTRDGMRGMHDRAGAMHDRAGGMQERAMKPADRAEARLSYIKTALKITPAQEPQWNAYAGFVRKATGDMQQRFEQRRAQGRPQASPDTIQRLERQQAMHAEAQQRLAALIAVQKPLYDVLTPEQRKVADEVLSPRRMAMRGGFRRG